MNKAQAYRLAKQIREYWRAHGYAVDVWVETDYRPGDKEGSAHVRSNLRNGLPPKATYRLLRTLQTEVTRKFAR